MKKSTILLFSLIGVFILLFVFKKPIKKYMTRGYKNNNVGNIRKTPKKWVGEIDGSDPDFKTFKSIDYGYRAIFILLNTYFSLGKNTIEKIISTYAPTNENDTKSYINSVSTFTGIPANEKLSLSDTDKIKKIVAGISYHENGIKPNLIELENGYKLYKS